MLIQFYHLPKTLDKEILTEVITHFVELSKASIIRLVYNFVSGEELLQMNKTHLQHNYETDILTFDYGSNTQIEAEVYISCKAIQEALARFSQTPENESVRLIAHGLFHCLGQKDKTLAEKKEMKALEEAFIKTFHVKQEQNV